MDLGITLDDALMKASPVLREKMKRSVELIHKAEKLSLMYDDTDGFFLAFSGGKDSQALYHITQLAGVKFKAHFSPTTVDPPRVIRFIRREYPECEFGKVEKNIYDMAVEKQILPTTRVRWCCAEYKEMAGAGKVTLIGIRHAESARRAKRNEVEISNHKFSGDFEQFTEWQAEKIKKKYKNLNQDQFSYDKEQTVRCISGKDSILVSPIIDWTEADVWEFLNKVCEVPHCELYDIGYHRIGCILCPMSNYKQKLKECQDFPYVKEKWIDAIKKIRAGGGITRQTYCLPQINGGGRADLYGDSTEWTSTRPQNGGGINSAEQRIGCNPNQGQRGFQVPYSETMDGKRSKLGGEFGKRYTKEQFNSPEQWLSKRKSAGLRENRGIWKDGGLPDNGDYP